MEPRGRRRRSSCFVMQHHVVRIQRAFRRHLWRRNFVLQQIFNAWNRAQSPEGNSPDHAKAKDPSLLQLKSAEQTRETAQLNPSVQMEVLVESYMEKVHDYIGSLHSDRIVRGHEFDTGDDYDLDDFIDDVMAAKKKGPLGQMVEVTVDELHDKYMRRVERDEEELLQQRILGMAGTNVSRPLAPGGLERDLHDLRPSARRNSLGSLSLSRTGRTRSLRLDEAAKLERVARESQAGQMRTLKVLTRDLRGSVATDVDSPVSSTQSPTGRRWTTRVKEYQDERFAVPSELSSDTPRGEGTCVNCGLPRLVQKMCPATGRRHLPEEMSEPSTRSSPRSLPPLSEDGRASSPRQSFGSPLGQASPVAFAKQGSPWRGVLSRLQQSNMLTRVKLSSVEKAAISAVVGVIIAALPPCNRGRRNTVVLEMYKQTVLERKEAAESLLTEMQRSDNGGKESPPSPRSYVTSFYHQASKRVHSGSDTASPRGERSSFAKSTYGELLEECTMGSSPKKTQGWSLDRPKRIVYQPLPAPRAISPSQLTRPSSPLLFSPTKSHGSPRSASSSRSPQGSQSPFQTGSKLFTDSWGWHADNRAWWGSPKSLGPAITTGSRSATPSRGPGKVGAWRMNFAPSGQLR
eukprot:Sspe_Gene.103834::Locus_79694_Transcript_1_1_Confidence_1.000_Length_2149::g.103834::m.103834